MIKESFGELIGTFILVFVGCGSVAGAVFLGWFDALWQVALIWGAGVALAIYTTRSICSAHINPAVSLAMFIRGEINGIRLIVYSLVQLVGAFLAGMTLYLILKDQILTFELAKGITRGTQGSVISAQSFGEFFPNPGYSETIKVSHLQAILWETGGTFILVKMVFLLIQIRNRLAPFIPVFIGLTVTLLILIIAPYTQAGINPARDLGPRMFAYFAGWGEAALPTARMSFLTVYVIGPFIGAALAAWSDKWKKASRS